MFFFNYILLLAIFFKFSTRYEQNLEKSIVTKKLHSFKFHSARKYSYNAWLRTFLGNRILRVDFDIAFNIAFGGIGNS